MGMDPLCVSRDASGLLGQRMHGHGHRLRCEHPGGHLRQQRAVEHVGLACVKSHVRRSRRGTASEVAQGVDTTKTRAYHDDPRPRHVSTAPNVSWCGAAVTPVGRGHSPTHRDPMYEWPGWSSSSHAERYEGLCPALTLHRRSMSSLHPSGAVRAARPMSRSNSAIRARGNAPRLCGVELSRPKEACTVARNSGRETPGRNTVRTWTHSST